MPREFPKSAEREILRLQRVGESGSAANFVWKLPWPKPKDRSRAYWVLSQLALCSPLFRPVKNPSEEKSATVHQHVQRVANGLLPAAVVRGQVPLKMCIVDEMKALHVPGLSITMIHDGKIQWTKAFGVKRLDGDAVTAGTIFQAGSVSKPVAAMAALRLVRRDGFTSIGTLMTR